MARLQDSQLVSVEFNDGAHRFCLDRIPENDRNFDPECPYRLAWRGDSSGADKLVLRPAYFNWELLGETIRRALDSGRLTFAEFQPFLETLLGSQS